VFAPAVDYPGGGTHRLPQAVAWGDVRGDFMVGLPEYPTRQRRRRSIVIALVASDALMLAVATSAASLVRFGRLTRVSAHLDGQIVTFAELSFIIAGIWIVSLYLEHLYNLERVFSGTGEYTRVIRGLSLGVIAFILATYFMRLPGLSRGWTVLAWAFGIAFVVLGRSIVRTTLSRLRARGFMMRPTLIVGANSEAADIVAHLCKNPAAGYVPIGCLTGPRPIEGDRRRPKGLDGCGGVPCLGYADDIQRVLDERYVDTVVIASTAFDHDVLASIINQLRGRDLDIQMSPGLLDVISSRVQVREVSSLPLITIQSVSFSRGKVLVKRIFDLVVGGAIAILGLPVWALIAVLIKLDSPGPVFYRQIRVGRDAKSFAMFKFRSMCDRADGRLDELSDSNEATGPLFKLQNDPRVTRIGKWMRLLSIDEFPQLLNVLRGEMSLVGPRPPLPRETMQYSVYDWRRMEVLPGMTGLWQVSGRSSLSFAEMVRLDLFYIENWSVTFDLALIVRTVPAVLFARGAY